MQTIPSGSTILKKPRKTAHNNMNKKPSEGCDKEANTGSAGSRPRHNQWGTTLIVHKGDRARNKCA
jgi:hypothetical protein